MPTCVSKKQVGGASFKQAFKMRCKYRCLFSEPVDTSYVAQQFQDAANSRIKYIQLMSWFLKKINQGIYKN